MELIVEEHGGQNEHDPRILTHRRGVPLAAPPSPHQGLGWLVISGIFALIGSIQLHTPGFMAVCPVFTYGSTVAIAETAFVYGWLANAGLALALWVLGRLSGEPLRAQNWALGGAIFWNLGVLAP